MKKINTYLLEKFKISKNSLKNCSHDKLSFEDWKAYLNDIGLEYDIEKRTDYQYLEIKIKNTSVPTFNSTIFKDENCFRLSSIHLGKYDGKFDKKAKFTTEWWKEEYDLGDNPNDYYFTMNNANVLKEKLQDVINISK